MHVKSILLVLTLLALPCDGALMDTFSVMGECNVTGKVTINGRQKTYTCAPRGCLSYFGLDWNSYTTPPCACAQFNFSKPITRAGGKVSNQGRSVTYWASASRSETFPCTFSGRVYPSGKQLKAKITFFGKATDGSKDYIKGTITFVGPKPK